MAQGNRALQQKRLKLKLQTNVYAIDRAQLAINDGELERRNIDASDLIAAYIASGRKIKKCRTGAHVTTFVKGATVTLGAASPGRSTHVAGYRHVYSK
jgi:hypothetical protein